METVYVLSARFMNNVGTVRLITGVINAIIYFVKPQLTSLAQLHNFRFTSFKLLLRRQLSSPRDGRWSSPGLVLALQFICSFEFFMRRVWLNCVILEAEAFLSPVVKLIGYSFSVITIINIIWSSDKLFFMK